MQRSVNQLSTHVGGDCSLSQHSMAVGASGRSWGQRRKFHLSARQRQQLEVAQSGGDNDGCVEGSRREVPRPTKRVVRDFKVNRKERLRPCYGSDRELVLGSVGYVINTVCQQDKLKLNPR